MFRLLLAELHGDSAKIIHDRIEYDEAVHGPYEPIELPVGKWRILEKFMSMKTAEGRIYWKSRCSR